MAWTLVTGQSYGAVPVIFHIELIIDLASGQCQIGAMPTIRRNVYLSEPQDAYLAAEAERLGISITELLRRIVDQHREKEAATPKPRKADR